MKEIDKENLIKFLKDNLRVKIWLNEKGSSYGHGGGLNVQVQIYLGDELVSESDDTCSLNQG